MGAREKTGVRLERICVEPYRQVSVGGGKLQRLEAVGRRWLSQEVGKSDSLCPRLQRREKMQGWRKERGRHYGARVIGGRRVNKGLVDDRGGTGGQGWYIRKRGMKKVWELERVRAPEGKEKTCAAGVLLGNGRSVNRKGGWGRPRGGGINGVLLFFLHCSNGVKGGGRLRGKTGVRN